MKTVTEKLQSAYDWYIASAGCEGDIHYLVPMSFDEWLAFEYNAYHECRFNHDGMWCSDKLGSIQDDMEKAFEEHEKAQFLPTEDEERDLCRFQYCRTHRDNPLYFAKKYVQMMSEGKYDRMTRFLQKAVKRLNNEGLTEFNQYVRDLVMTTI